MIIPAGLEMPTLFAALWFSFASFGIGSLLPNPTLTSMDRSAQSFLADDRITIFVFFDPEQEQSEDLLRELAGFAKELTDRSVHWTGIVSDRFPMDQVKNTMASAPIGMTTVVDRGDKLYGELGVRLYPSVGIASAEHQLMAYLPYQKVNYLGAVRAHTRYALGEISQAERDAAVVPARVEWGGNGSVAKRNLRLSKMLLDAGKPEKALAKAKEAIEASPDLPEAHGLLAAIQAQLDDCEGAKKSLEKAIELDPEYERGKAALEHCL